MIFAFAGTVLNQPVLLILSFVTWLGIHAGFARFLHALLQVFWLAYFARVRPKVVSHRQSDIDYIREFVESGDTDFFLVVHGAKGVGKSCAIKTALASFRAVFLSPPILSGTSSTDIKHLVLSNLTKTNYDVREMAETIS